jgi:hypothetical protein
MMTLIDILLQVTPEVNTLPSVSEGLDNLTKLSIKSGIRLGINLFFVILLIRFIYYRIYKNTELLFTYIVFNLVIFFICFLLNKVELSMGAALGLFAVFSMLRYRTEGISIKDMTYLFLVIAMGLISAVTKIKDAEDFYEYLFIFGINGVLVLVTWLLESNWLVKSEMVKTIYYEKIELVHQSRNLELIEDLKKRTGLPIHRIEVNKIDFLRDTAIIKIYFY